MIRKIVWQTALFVALTSTTWAQEHRVEINPFFGYTLSEGINVDNNSIIGIVVDEVNPTSALSYGFQFGVFINENVEIGFLFSQQDSNLELKGTAAFGKAEVADMKVNNYHAVFTYNFAEEDTMARPFIFGGLGATQYDPGNVEGQPIDGTTKLSSTWGGGVKVYPSPRVGVTFMGRWTPTYIKSDPGGIWCSPYWPCWIVPDNDYSNQLEFSGGISFRF